MINIQFINNDFQEWTKLELTNGYIWHSRQIQKEHIKKIQSLILLKNDLNIKMLKEFLLNIKCHFGLVIINDNIVIAATDVARTYPLFYHYEKNNLVISPQAKKIASINTLKVNKENLLAYRMSGYTAGSGTLWTKIKGLLAGQFLLLNRKLSVTTYYNSLSSNKKNYNSTFYKKKLKENIFNLLEHTAHKADGRRIVIPLSAGLDSRLIASGLKHIGYKNITCFSYGLKNNFEALMAKKIAAKLNFKWHFIEISQKKIKDFYKSELYSSYFIKNIDGCATPGIQDIYSIYRLKELKYFTDEDIIVNGNSGDFTTGGHLPKISSTWKKTIDLKDAYNQSINLHLSKHYSLWDNLRNKKNDSIIKKMLFKQLQEYPLGLKGHIDPFVLIELLEYHNRQTKFVINLQRIYDYYGIDWLLPLWNKEVIDFWKGVPLREKLNQKLYKSTLHELNLSNVWLPEYNSKIKTSPQYMRPVRLLCKSAHLFSGSNAWHKFEKKYLNYWTDNICGYSMYEYKYIINNNHNARNSVAWHTLNSEEKLFKYNWQNKKNG
jgi:asparagine synthase (glutamine-hydrolysing)